MLSTTCLRLSLILSTLQCVSVVRCASYVNVSDCECAALTQLIIAIVASKQ